MHGADADYLADNLPDEDALWEMTERAMRLPEFLGASGPYRRYPSDPPVVIAEWTADDGHRVEWFQPSPFTEPFTTIARDKPPVAPPPKPPITDAIAREAAYSEAKREQRKGGGAQLSTADRDALEAHVKDLERMANDIELRRIGSEIIDSAVATMRMASLGLVRASSPVQGAY